MSAPIPRPGPPPNRPVPGTPVASHGTGPSVGGHGAGGQSGAPSTVAAVQAAVADLDQLDDVPLADHVARYDAVHGTLSEALAAIDGV